MAREKSYEGPYASSKVMREMTMDPTVDETGNSVERTRQIDRVVNDDRNTRPGSAPLPKV